MKPSTGRLLSEYARLRKEAFRLHQRIDAVPAARNAFRSFLDQNRASASALEQANAPAGQLASDLTVATIMDEFSSDNWAPEFCNIMLSFDGWEREIGLFEPDLLFVESAWKGNYSQWSYALEAPRTHSRARELDRLIEHCRQRGIPTIFWNKEDPLHFDKFVDSAKLFDFVFTTDADIISKYREALGHERVFALPFAAQPCLCNPVMQTPDIEANAFFAGSYYAFDHGTRAEQMEILFDALLEHEGVIYDRSFFSDSPDVQMPAKYLPICRPPVPFDQIVNVYKRHMLALNVNSVTNSATMMSRRVFEVLACARPVVSTPSQAITQMLGNIVDCVSSFEEASAVIAKYMDDPDLAARVGHLGYREVLGHHTYNHRLAYIASVIDQVLPDAALSERVRSRGDDAKITLILPCDCPSKTKNIVSSIAQQTYRNFELVLIAGPPVVDSDVIDLLPPEFTVRVISRNTDESIDALLAKALDDATGQHAVLLSEAQIYWPNLLSDLLLPMRYTEADIFGKASRFAYDEKTNETWLLEPQSVHRYVAKLNDGPILLSRRAIRALVDFTGCGERSGAFFARAASLGLRIYSGDPYNAMNATGEVSPHQRSEGRFLGKGKRLDLCQI